jgi:hypothetical protein
MSVRLNQAPNVTGLLNTYVGRYADAWAHAHRDGDPRAGEWIRLAVQTLRAEHWLGGRWCLNGKRGDPNNQSWDIVGFVVDEANDDPKMIEAYDVIAGAGGPNPTIYWGNVTNYDTIGQPGTAIAIHPPPRSTAPQPPGLPSLWTEAHSALLARLGAAPLPTVASQFVFSFPADGWGQKRADGSRPVSDNVLARLVGGKLYGYQVVPRPTGAPDQWSLDGQVFVPTPAVNHLGDGEVPAPPPTPPVPPVVPPTPCPCATSEDLAAAVAVIGASIDAVSALIVDLAGQEYRINASARMIGPITGTASPKE